MTSFSYFLPLMLLIKFETSDPQATGMNSEPLWYCISTLLQFLKKRAVITKHIEMKPSLLGPAPILDPRLCPRCAVTPADIQTCHGLRWLRAFGPESPTLNSPPYWCITTLPCLYDSEPRSGASSSGKLSLIPQAVPGPWSVLPMH